MPSSNFGAFGQSINNGMFTLPNIYNPTALLGQAPKDDINAENVQMFVPPIAPDFGAPLDAFTNFFGSYNELTKKLGLLLLALLFVGFGLYLLAKDTETFKIAIDSAKTVATRGAV